MHKNNFPIFKNFFTLTQFFFFVCFIISAVNAKGYQRVLGLGPGTFIEIVFIVIGAIICLVGLCFPNPGLFIFIGIALPLLVFVILWGITTDDDNNDENDEKKNPFIVARWIHFLVMLLLVLGLFFPLLMLFNITLIPQRVDSRAQKEYDEKYLKLMEEQRKRKYNVEDEIIDQDDEKLPLVIKKTNNRPVVRRNNDVNNLGNLISSTNSIKNNYNNSIGINDNNSGQNSSQLPPVLPKTSLRNDLDENRKKFHKFKRTGQNNN